MGLFSWTSIISGKDIYNQYSTKHKGIAMLMPNDSLIVGDYDGYGGIITPSGEVIDIYGKVAEIMFGKYNRDLIFTAKKTVSTFDDEVVGLLDKDGDWDDKITAEDVVEHHTSDVLIGKTMNELKSEGYKFNTVFDLSQVWIKVMTKTEVASHIRSGKSFDDYTPSSHAYSQGHG